MDLCGSWKTVFSPEHLQRILPPNNLAHEICEDRETNMKAKAKFLSLVFLAGTAACGGGGGSTPTPTPTPPPTVSVTITSCPTVTQRGVTAWNGTPWYVCTASVSNASNSTVTWSSSPATMLTIDSSTGALTPLARGKVTVTATSVADPTKSASVAVSVVDRLTLTKAEPLAWLPGDKGMLLWYVETDGSDSEELLYTRECWYPAMSPDHRHIACSTFPLPTETLNGTELIVVTTGGTPAGTTASAPLTNIKGVLSDAWSPDGKKVVFVGAQNDSANPGNTLVGVFTINADGTGMAQLTSESFSGNTIRIPGSASFSPDGKSIAYGVDADDYIRIMDADGSNPVVLPVEGFNPVFTPDGSKILFLNASFSQVESMNPDGSDPQVLIDQDAYSLAISPDGSQIAYELGVSYYIAGINGSSPTTVPGTTAVPYLGSGVAW